MTDPGTQIAALSPEKRKLLARLLKQEGLDLKRVPIPKRPSGVDRFPLSSAQRRLWFLDQLEPHSPLYNLPSAFRLTGRLDLAAARRALEEIVRRHEALRTVFESANGQPVQRILPGAQVALPVSDLTGKPEADVLRAVQAEARLPFDLSRGPLMRARLFRVAEEDHVAVFTMHHIISDGWSMGVMIREFAALYQAYAAGRPACLPELPLQYADYALWQQEFDDHDQLEWWKGQLGGKLPVLDLPTDRPRSQAPENPGASHRFLIAGETTEALKSLAEHEGATLFMALLAAFQLLLARHSGQQEICAGTPVANRTRTELEPLIGFFVNTLVIRTSLAGDPTFRELLGRVRETSLGAFAHQDLPFDMLVERLNPERRRNRSPLFQAMFVFQNTPAESLRMPGLTLAPLEAETGLALFDLTFSAAETPRGLSATFQYNSALWDERSIVRMAERFRTLLEAIVAGPDRRTGDLSLLPTSEQAQIIHEWNGRAASYSVTQTLHELFEAQAERTPEAVAVSCEQQVLTYRELNRRANCLAGRLRRLGAGPEIPVALYMERSADVVAGILGILKSGSPYVPLDPVYPPERLQFILEDCGARLLVTHHALRGRLPGFSGHVVAVDDPSAEIETSPPAHRASPENAAYIIYTSGSTGRPKGVVVTHANVARLLAATAEWYRFDNRDVWTLFHSFAFDFSVWEIWGALLYGGRLVVAPYLTTRSPEAFLRLLVEERVTVLNQTPSAFLQLIAAEKGGSDLALRLVIFGGEALDFPSLKPWFERHLERPQLVNMYGITETTVHTTFRPVLPEDAETPRGSLVGVRLPDLRVYILDERGNLAPIGVPGELCAGGPGLARGYLNRPDLTAERFIPDAFSGQPGARLYRSGDRARYLGGGDIEYLGRIDFQVKIRGFRVELGEIESVLAQHPAVERACVVVREGGLAAYTVGAASAGDLRAFLRTRLPDYMVPAHFVPIDSLPLTANGKVDRSALPEPGAARPELDSRFLAPRTPQEEILAGIWAQLLRVERVGVEDSFFELGGHSLLATQLMSRIRDAFGVEAPLRTLFETPTVAGLAKALEGSRSAAPSIRPAPRSGPLPLSFAQQRLWFLDQLEPGTARYHIPDAVRIRGPLDIARWEQCLNAIVARHEILRTVVTTAEGQAAQVILPELRLTIPVTEAASEADAVRLAGEEIRRPFDLACGPLLRLRLLRLAGDDHILVLTMHHIVSDGWSAGILIREFAGLYAGVSLAPLEIQYADYARWQREWLRGETLDAHLEYWRKQLSGAPVLNLPADRARAALGLREGGLVAVSLPRELVRNLRSLGEREGTTLFMTLLAAFQALLGRYSGQEDFTVGSPVAGRNRAELEPLIGLFVNTLVLRADLSGDPGFGELLRRTRETCLDAYAHQDVPFEMLVEQLEPQRDLTRTPLFQAMFALQNLPAVESLQIPGIRLERAPIETGAAKFDLMLTLTEKAEGIEGVFEYAAGLFDRSTIERMAAHFRNVLESAVADPAAPVSKLRLMSEAEEKTLVIEWNRTSVELPEPACFPALFEAQAAKTPDAPAVSFKGEVLTYAELNVRADRLAGHLSAAGVVPDTIVGLYMERSLDMVVAILGVLKSGGAYLPIDPAYPPDRIAFMLEDSGAPVLITDAALRGHIPPYQGAILQAGDSPSQKLPPITHHPSPTNLAYVIYTSGSTGRPKGVMVEHRSMVNLNTALERNIYGHHPEVRCVSLNAPLSFDASVQQIVSLASGRKLDILPDEVRRDGALLLEHIRRYRLDGLDCVPSQLKLLISAGMLDGSGHAPSVVLPGGEAIDEATWAILARADSTDFYNVYGPTECTVDSTSCRARRHPERPSIGRPLSNARLYVLDAQLHPVPIGVPGEMYIAGAGLARGYLNRPGMTAEKFLPDPFSGIPGSRMYRTGDLVRYLAGGNVEFLGRVDHQVKVRGYRIELGEIEAVLREHEAVKDAAVIAREDTPGEKRLIAYFTPAADPPPTVGQLREHLRGRLPDYMMPSAFVILDRFPLTPNGKVDRRALPAPVVDRPNLDGAYREPRTPEERKLAAVWRDVLRIGRVGMDDNFFELGGDSILSIQVVAKAAQAGLRITPRQLFQFPTIARLAEVAEPARIVHAEQGIVEGPLPATPIQRWFFEQGFAEPHHFNQSVLLALDAPLNRARLEAAVRRILEHHDTLRLRVRDGQLDIAGGGDAAPVCYSGDFAAAQAGFVLESGPLLRVVYSEDTRRLLIAVHHLGVDGVSWRILLEDFARAYQGLPLAPKTTSFREWAQRLERYAESVRGEVPFWRRVWEGAAPAMTERPPERAARSIAVSLEESETEALLKQVAPVYRTEINDALLAAFAEALQGWQGRGALVVDLEGHGREQIAEDIDISRTVGWFTSMYPVRLDVSDARGPGEALKRVKEQLRAVPNRGLGYGLLRYTLGDLQDLPQPDIGFNYLGQFDQAIEGLPAGFRPAVEPRGPERSLSNHRSHLLDVTAGIVRGRLSAEWTYSQGIHSRGEIERLAGRFLDALRRILAHCQSPDAGGYTPSDFPLAKLDQQRLDRLLKKIR